MNYQTIVPEETIEEKISRLLHKYYETHGYPPLMSVVVSGAEVEFKGFEFVESAEEE
jgi:hypothetical protein